LPESRRRFAHQILELATRPFPERYVHYRKARLRPYEEPPNGRVSNDLNLALILVMTANFRAFGPRRVGTMLGWSNVQVARILQYGVRQGHLERATSSLFRCKDLEGALAKIRPEA
jgi:hypothetical protein